MISRPPIIPRHPASLRHADHNGSQNAESSFPLMSSSSISVPVASASPTFQHDQTNTENEAPLQESCWSPALRSPRQTQSTSLDFNDAVDELPVSEKLEHNQLLCSRVMHRSLETSHLKISILKGDQISGQHGHHNSNKTVSTPEAKSKSKNFSLFSSSRSDILKDIKSKHHFNAHSLFKEHSNHKNWKLTSNFSSSYSGKHCDAQISKTTSLDVADVTKNILLPDSSYSEASISLSSSLPSSVVSSSFHLSTNGNMINSKTQASSFDHACLETPAETPQDIVENKDCSQADKPPTSVQRQISISEQMSPPTFSSSNSFDSTYTVTSQLSSKPLISTNSLDDSTMPPANQKHKLAQSQRTCDGLSLFSQSSVEVMSTHSTHCTTDNASLVSQTTLDASFLPQDIAPGDGSPLVTKDAPPPPPSSSSVTAPPQTLTSTNVESVPSKLRISSSSESEDEGWLLLNDTKKVCYS